MFICFPTSDGKLNSIKIRRAKTIPKHSPGKSECSSIVGSFY